MRFSVSLVNLGNTHKMKGLDKKWMRFAVAV
jgi:hypothetical protein